MFKILVIDDEPDIRLALSITLEDNGYEVVEGSDGSEALDLAIAHAPDLIILDLNMPNIDGFTALKMLKSDERTSHVPVCILTAVKDPSQEQHAAALGADDFIGKPWSEERLIRGLAELINRREAHSSGALSSSVSASDEPKIASPTVSDADRAERLTETIRARHNAWSPLS